MQGAAFLVRVELPFEQLRCPVCLDKAHDVFTAEPLRVEKPWSLKCSNGHAYQLAVDYNRLEANYVTAERV
jgi:hypothetical protein